MAKRRKKHHAPRWRRRMSGISAHGIQGDLMEAAGVVLGSVAGTVIQRQFTSMNPKVVSGVQLVAGIMLKRHAKSPIMSGAGWGLMGAGAIGLTHEVGLIHGVEDFVSGYLQSEHEMQGISNESYMGGISNEDHVGDIEEDWVDQM
jgi:hypothetical protein